MNDTANTGAAPAVTPADASAVAAATGTTAAATTGPFDGLQDAESREWVATKGYKDVGAVVSDARYADKLKAEIGDLKAKSLTLPGADASKEDWAAFHAKIGRPEAADKYEFAMPQDLPKDLPYDGEMATSFKQEAFSVGLRPEQAQALHDWSARQAAKGMQAQVEANAARRTEAHKALMAAWGDAGSDTYKAAVADADRFIANNGGDALMAELKANGLMADDGAVLSPRLAQAMAKAGKAYQNGGDPGFVSGGVPTQRQSLESRLFPNG